MTDMKTYVGTKVLNAKPMSLGDYNKFRDWEVPSNEDPATAGYLVEYLDGGKANTEGYAGYVSWSPKDAFEKSYQPVDEMSFGHAMMMVDAGYRVARKGWNGKGMWIVRVGTGYYDVGISIVGVEHVGFTSWIGMKAADNKFGPWAPSQLDMNAVDWVIVEVKS